MLINTTSVITVQRNLAYLNNTTLIVECGSSRYWTKLFFFCHTKLTVLCTDLLCTDFGNNGRNILFQKFWSEMRICKGIDTGLSACHLFIFTTTLIILFAYYAYGLLSFINYSLTILMTFYATCIYINIWRAIVNAVMNLRFP